MKTIRCIIVDDEPVARRILEGYLTELEDFDLVASCSNALEASEVLNQKDIDLMFLDIEMPKLKGLDFIRILPVAPTVIITTAHREFALDSFELEVLDYLLKPISFDRFFKACLRYKKMFGSAPKDQDRDFLYAKSNRKMAKIRITDILYIEGMSNYVRVICQNNTYTVYTSLSSLLEDLPEAFLRIHKSYIINKNKVAFFSKEQVEINKVQLPIGKTYQQEVAEKL
jgi:DNA-binding LytR/AlgR family response regulator